MPSPRKLSAPSITITMPIPSIANVISCGPMFGAMCRSRIRQAGVPHSFAATMNGCSRSRSVAAREMRANAGMRKNASARIVFRWLGPEALRDRQGEHQRRERDQDVQHAHDDAVDDAAEVAATARRALPPTSSPSRFTGQRHDQRRPPAVQDPGRGCRCRSGRCRAGVPARAAAGPDSRTSPPVGGGTGSTSGTHEAAPARSATIGPAGSADLQPAQPGPPSGPARSRRRIDAPTRPRRQRLP